LDDTRSRPGEEGLAMNGADWNLYILLAVFWLVFVLSRSGSR